MIPGFNTDFKYRGETYHVQTEDNGVANPVVVTLLYHKGAILASRRTPYNDLIDKPGFEQSLKGLMKSQHQDLMRALLAGAYDKDGAAPEIIGASGEHPAVAAASVGVGAQKTAPKPQRPPAPGAPPRPTPVATAALPPTTGTRAAPAPAEAAMTLDEAIRDYLMKFAAAAAATAT